MFELTISKNDLLTPLLAVSAAVDKKQVTPILSNILLNLNDNQLTLTATDLEIEITARIPCITQTETGVVTVPAKKMIDIIRSLDDDANPTIKFEHEIVTIKEGRSRFKLATLPADNYPSASNEPIDLKLNIERTLLAQLLQSTYFAMSQQDVRTYLNGLLIEIDGQGITAVATDGHRMAIHRLPSKIETEHTRLLIPKKGIQEMLRLLNHVNDETVLLSAGVNHIQLTTKEYTLSSKRIEARFPPYARAIPREQNKFVTVDRDLLKRALARIIILANEKSRAVLLHIQSNQLTLIANNQEQEEAIETVVAQTQGDELKIGINATYLLDVLTHLEEGLLRLSFSNTDSSILVEPYDNEAYQYIIMPMKI